ncbi:hypothetical protein JB92DRAFT_2838746 [Gautieria morchelliformis]|nr:hypothetical protein JB92DRAFT_2838746 [Gautieria morchelliformis]
MEWSHFSVLRDESLLKALKAVDYDNRHNLIISDDSVKTMTTFMSRVAARTITDVEREVCMFASVYAHYTPGNTLRILGALGELQCRPLSWYPCILGNPADNEVYDPDLYEVDDRQLFSPHLQLLLSRETQSGMASKKQAKLIIEWLEQTLQADPEVIDWPSKDYAKVHGAGTSRIPNCRAQIMLNSAGQYQATLVFVGDDQSEHPALHNSPIYVMSSGDSVPTTTDLWRALLGQVKALDVHIVHKFKPTPMTHSFLHLLGVPKNFNIFETISTCIKPTTHLLPMQPSASPSACRVRVRAEGERGNGRLRARACEESNPETEVLPKVTPYRHYSLVAWSKAMPPTSYDTCASL